MNLFSPPPPSVWDPYLNMIGRNPSKECLQRVHADLKSLIKDSLPGIYCIPDDNHSTVVHALVIGPFDTPYEGGFFHFIINCPDDYPISPPRVKLLTTGGGEVRFNPNLYACGKVCLSILGTWAGPGWSPIQSIGSVLMSIQSLMNENPYHNEPGFEIARNSTDVYNYNCIIKHETIRVAVLEMINDSQMAKTLPQPLREVISGLFPSYIESYLIICEQHKHLDGQNMADPFGEKRGIYCFSEMEKKLQELSYLYDEKEIEVV